MGAEEAPVSRKTTCDLLMSNGLVSNTGPLIAFLQIGEYRRSEGPAPREILENKFTRSLLSGQYNAGGPHAGELP